MSRLEGRSVVRVGLLGLGTVGAGVVQILRDSRPPLRDKTGLDIRLHRVAARDLKKARAVGLDPALLTTDAHAVAVVDPEVDILVEVIGGIEPARSLVLAALESRQGGRHGQQGVAGDARQGTFEAALAANTSIGFEASVCGGVPVIDAIRDGLVANRIESIHAILNGTTNYILTRMIQNGAPYAQALYEAQSKGYAEADPSTDVKGIDAGHKLTLLSNLAFHTVFDFAEAHIEGIDGVNIDDVRIAGEMGYTLKLLGIAKRRSPGADPEELPGGVELRVHPTLIANSHPLASVRDVFNAVLVRGDATGEVMLYGRGAGMLPTASAVIADVVDAARGSARQTFTETAILPEPARRICRSFR